MIASPIMSTAKASATSKSVELSRFAFNKQLGSSTCSLGRRKECDYERGENLHVIILHVAAVYFRSE
jgi:hypothetical protein